MESTESVRYQFGEFTLDTGARLLTGRSGSISLTPKEFKALLLLVEAGGKAVERESMIQSLWPDTSVGETSLGRVISVLRRHLGTEAILSIAKFGYRFSPQVVILGALPEGEVTKPHTAEVTQPAQNKSEPVQQPVVVSRPKPESTLGVWGGRVALAVALVGLVALLTTVSLQHFLGRSVRSEAVRAAAQWDQIGMFALREGTFFKASKAFEQAALLDPSSAIVHAHLAEASLELDYIETARNEVLLASDRTRVHNMSEIDQRYLNAVRATAVRDYAMATQERQAILAALPESEKSGGFEDLGRAYQREGRIAEAIQSYQNAAKLQPVNAGVQLHLGILMGLQQNQGAANAFLDRAMSLYDASTNLEGAAEVNYQRGSMAYVRGDYHRAEHLYNLSLEIADRLSDPQMQARSLGALSTVERWDGKFKESLEHANREIEVSRAAGSDFGYAEGVMLLANLSLAKQDLPQSRAQLKLAMDLAQKVRNPRLEANAEFSMADLVGRTGDFMQEIVYAHRAMDHYRTYGSEDGIADTWLLIVQGEAGKGDFANALKDAQRLLESSQRANSEMFVEDAEAELGHIYTKLGNDPVALTHYERALDISRKTGSEQALKSLHVVGCLVSMGHVREAASLFRAIPVSARSDPDTAYEYAEVHILIEIGLGHDALALALARKAHAQAMAPEAGVNFAEILTTLEARAGQASQAAQDSEELLLLAKRTDNPYRSAQALLAGALVALSSGSPAKAKDMAEAAFGYFRANNMHKLEWMALLYEAQALHDMGDASRSALVAKQSQDALMALQHDWPAKDSQAYMSRPDVRQCISKMGTLANRT